MSKSQNNNVVPSVNEISGYENEISNISEYKNQVKKTRKDNRTSLFGKFISAFTLAEVLMTLVIIGVVSALVVPMFVSGLYDGIYDKKKKNFESKIYAGMSRMRADGLLNKSYDSTEEFVEQMKKYFSITNVCSNSELDKCFTAKNYKDFERTIYAESSTNLLLGEVQVIDLTTVKTAKDLIPKSTLEANIVGVLFGDGIEALIVWNPDSDYISPYNMEADPTQGIAILYDVNPAKRSPNTTNDDIGKYNLYADVDFPYTVLGDSVNRSYAECLQVKEKYPELPKACYSNWPEHSNTYIIAYGMCRDIGMKLPTSAQLNKFRDKLDLYSSGQYYSRNKMLREKLLWSGNGNPSKIYGSCVTTDCSKVYALMTYGNNFLVMNNDGGSESVRRVAVVCVDEE